MKASPSKPVTNESLCLDQFVAMACILIALAYAILSL